jgi:tetratricopeptide (TPR) repeat protein
MKRAYLPVIFLLFAPALISAPVFSQSKTGLAEASKMAASANPYLEVDQLMTFGEDLERDKRSLEIAEKGLSVDGSSNQWLWRVARACFFVGDGVPKDEKLRYFNRGIEVGERAIAQQPDSVEAHFWLAVNYGGFAEQKGAIKALRMVKKIRTEMETVLRLNDRYHDASAYHALGEMDRQLPRLFGGNLQRAISRLEHGVRVAPDNLQMKYVLAQAYQDAGRNDEARRQLNEIIGRQINPARANSERRTQEKARQLLNKL